MVLRHSNDPNIVRRKCYSITGHQKHPVRYRGSPSQFHAADRKTGWALPHTEDEDTEEGPGRVTDLPATQLRD